MKWFSVGIQPLQPLSIFSDKGSVSHILYKGGKKICWEGRRSEVRIKHSEQTYLLEKGVFVYTCDVQIQTPPNEAC